MKDLNKLKVGLAEWKRMEKWLTEQVEKATLTVFQGRLNKMEPSLKMQMRGVDILNVYIRKSTVSTKQ